MKATLARRNTLPWDFAERKDRRSEINKLLERAEKTRESLNQYLKSGVYIGLERERDAFLRLKPKLLEKYEGKWVAILNGEVIDFGENGSELAGKVYQKYGYRPIYIDKVERKPKIFKIPSPKVK